MWLKNYPKLANLENVYKQKCIIFKIIVVPLLPLGIGVLLVCSYVVINMWSIWVQEDLRLLHFS